MPKSNNKRHRNGKLVQSKDRKLSSSDWGAKEQAFEDKKDEYMPQELEALKQLLETNKIKGTYLLALKHCIEVKEKALVDEKAKQAKQLPMTANEATPPQEVKLPISEALII